LDSLDVVKNSIEVLDVVIGTLKVNTVHMAEALAGSYAFAVDLAERLTEETDFSFRETHIIVGNLIREMLSRGMKPKDLKPEMVCSVAEKVLGKKIAVNDTLIKGAIDPDIILELRKSVGGPSQEEVKRMIKTRRKFSKNMSESCD